MAQPKFTLYKYIKLKDRFMGLQQGCLLFELKIQPNFCFVIRNE
jgi:hypothetical protein